MNTALLLTHLLGLRDLATRRLSEDRGDVLTWKRT